jgi:hypothetical protein
VGSRAGLQAVEKKKLLMLPGFKIQFLICPARSLTTIPTKLSDSQQKAALNTRF